MDRDWLVYMIVIMALIFGADMYNNYTHSECAKSYASSNRTAEDIAKICKK